MCLYLGYLCAVLCLEQAIEKGCRIANEAFPQVTASHKHQPTSILCTSAGGVQQLGDTSICSILSSALCALTGALLMCYCRRWYVAQDAVPWTSTFGRSGSISLKSSALHLHHGTADAGLLVLLQSRIGSSVVLLAFFTPAGSLTWLDRRVQQDNGASCSPL